MSRTTGILADNSIIELLNSQKLLCEQSLDDNQIQPASIDLRLGNIAYRVRASFLPGKNKTVKEKLDQIKLHEISLKDGAVLETGCVYIVPLLESLRLPKDITACANPKSSTGRIDVLARVIGDKTQSFDKIPAGYCGPLYLEISPGTFPIVVRTGSRLSQIRFNNGISLLNDEELSTLHKQETLISTSDLNIHNLDIYNNGIGISIDLNGDENKLIGYRGKRHTSVIDVDKKSSHSILDFWEPIYNHGCASLILDPHEFYILASNEAIHVPPLYAAEMVPFDPMVGEFRVHYAGFFDPGFGNDSAGGKGARGVLEIRSHDVPFILEHNQLVGRLVYHNLLKKPDKLYGMEMLSHYQGQGLKLSKHFY